MKRTYQLLLSALFVPALGAAIAPADSLAFHPAAGTKLSRAWKIKQDLTLDDMQMTMNGQPLPVDLKMDMSMSMTNEIGVTDQIVSLREGAAKELLRTYDTLGSSGDFKMEMAMLPDGGMENSITGSSKLEGKTVKFAWNAESEDYDKSFHESEGEKDLLAHLDEDMDLSVVLPGKDVATGDTWDIEVKRLRPLLAPGGDVGIRPEKVGDDEIGGMMPGMNNMGDPSEWLGEMLEGKASAEYKGIEETDGGKYGVIALTIDIKSNNDMADKVADMLKNMPEGVGSMKIDHMDVELAIEAKGTVLWDIAAGHIHSVELSGEIGIDMDTGMAVEAQGKSMNIDQSVSMKGTIAINLDVTKG